MRFGRCCWSGWKRGLPCSPLSRQDTGAHTGSAPRSRGALCVRVLSAISFCPPCQTALPRTKGGGAPIGATVLWPHHTDAAARFAQRARLSALHRGSRLGDRTPPLSSGPRFTLWRIVTLTQGLWALAGLALCESWTLSTAKLSQTPGRPVVMPAGTMPKAAREQFAKPPAGAALAPHSGLPSGKRPLRERGDG
jgi:hypothetical protein